MPIVTQKNIAKLSNQINQGDLKCWVCVFSESNGFEVGYAVKKRWKAFNSCTRRYDGEWVEPSDELSRHLEENLVTCASLYYEDNFDKIIKDFGLWNTADYSDCLVHYLGNFVDDDLKKCYQKFSRPLLPWSDFANQAGSRRWLMNINA